MRFFSSSSSPQIIDHVLSKEDARGKQQRKYTNDVTDEGQLLWRSKDDPDIIHNEASPATGDGIHALDTHDDASPATEDGMHVPVIRNEASPAAGMGYMHWIPTMRHRQQQRMACMRWIPTMRHYRHRGM